MSNISSGFEKCKYIKDEFGDLLGSQPGAQEPGQSMTKPKKFHHNEELIATVCSMGFERTAAKKALKLTGDLANAVTFLLESGDAGLDQVSMSEEEDPAQIEEAKKKEDEARKV